MKFIYKNEKAVEPVKVYNGGTAKCGDVVDASNWPRDLVTKAIDNPDYEPVEDEMNETVTDAVEVTAGGLKLAEEYGIDAYSVVGTGNGGKVTKADVQAVVDGNSNGD